MNTAPRFELLPTLRQDARSLAEWLGEGGRLPCTQEWRPSGDRRCVEGGAHAWPCPRERLRRYTERVEEDATVRTGAAGLLRLLPHVRCTCDRVPHREGCETWGRLDWDLRFFERHELTRTHNARRDGEKALDCFDA